MRKKKPTRGRPKLPAGDGRTMQFRIRVNQDELDRIRLAATCFDQTPTEYARARLLPAQPEGEPAF